MRSSFVPVLWKDRDRHPLADDDQILPAVAVHVDPQGVGHHADVRQLGGDLRPSRR